MVFRGRYAVASLTMIALTLLALGLAYALSPIDLIPDFILLLGLLDDLVLLPIGIWMAVRMIPAEVWEECRRRAGESPPELDSLQT